MLVKTEADRLTSTVEVALIVTVAAAGVAVPPPLVALGPVWA